MSTTETKDSGPVVVYGPEGCGKNFNAAALAAHYGKSVIIEEWDPNSEELLPTDALVFTSSTTTPIGAISFAQAMREAGLVTTTAVATPSPRFCMNCVYFSYQRGARAAECSAPATQTISLVYGPLPNRCDQLRREGDSCGPDGLHFSQHEQPAKPVATTASSPLELAIQWHDDIVRGQDSCGGLPMSPTAFISALSRLEAKR